MVNADISPILRLERKERHFPNRLCLVYEGGDLTISQVAERARRFAGLLADGGVQPGDRVAYLGLNSPTLLVLSLACARIGAVFMPMNFRLAPAEMQFLLTDAEPHTLVVEPTYRAAIDGIRAATQVQRFLLVDDDPADPAPDQLPDGWASLAAAVSAVTEIPDRAPCQEDDLALLLCTSGTTGVPKGVMLTHGNVWWNQVNVYTSMEVKGSDRTLAAAPLFHIAGLNAFVLGTVANGGLVVVRRAFVPAQAIADIVEHRISCLFFVPVMFAAIAREPAFADADLSCVKVATVAGAPVPAALVRTFADRDIHVQQGWGLTETAAYATNLPAYLAAEKPSSCGIAMPHTEVCIKEPISGEQITEPGVRGEMCARGPNITVGSWRNEQATASAFDADGWFHSGDVGELDEDGLFYIVDRLKDMVISGGENTYPAEVEKVLAEMPGIVEVTVIGVPDEKWGEAVCAVVVPEPQTELTVDSVRDWAQSRLARYKLPKVVVAVDQLPKNGTGKVEKNITRQIVAEKLAHA